MPDGLRWSDLRAAGLGRGAGGAREGEGRGTGVGAHAAVAAGAEEVEQVGGEEGGLFVLGRVCRRCGGVPHAGEAFEAAEERDEEGEQHRIQRDGGFRAQFSRALLERGAQAGEPVGQGGWMGCHVGEYN